MRSVVKNYPNIHSALIFILYVVICLHWLIMFLKTFRLINIGGKLLRNMGKERENAREDAGCVFIYSKELCADITERLPGNECLWEHLPVKK